MANLSFLSSLVLAAGGALAAALTGALIFDALQALRRRALHRAMARALKTKGGRA